MYKFCSLQSIAFHGLCPPRCVLYGRLQYVVPKRALFLLSSILSKKRTFFLWLIAVFVPKVQPPECDFKGERTHVIGFSPIVVTNLRQVARRKKRSFFLMVDCNIWSNGTRRPLRVRSASHSSPRRGVSEAERSATSFRLPVGERDKCGKPKEAMEKDVQSCARLSVATQSAAARVRFQGRMNPCYWVLAPLSSPTCDKSQDAKNALLAKCVFCFGDSNGTRTHVIGVRGQRPRPLDYGAISSFDSISQVLRLRKCFVAQS